MPNIALPGNPRYQPKDLVEIFGYDNLVRSVAEVEIATLKTLGDIKVISSEDIALLTPDVEAALLAITTTEVDVIERSVTKHDIRAWVRLAQERIPVPLRRWVHIPLTSYDVIDTARTLQFVRAHEVVRTLTHSLMTHLCEQVYRYANTPQIGRTHGQHALPITIGFWFATYLNRLLTTIRFADKAAQDLAGKISGAVGAYNAQIGLGFTEQSDRLTFEERVLRKLGLQPATISTQILQPEPLAMYLFGCLQLSAAHGQFGRDGRNLMRTEIGELTEPFEAGQVGSSTMAHKRNPINFENLEGTWQKNQAEFLKVTSSLISEHQRDLVGSTVARDFPTIVVNLVCQLNTLLRESNGEPFISRLRVDTEACARNLARQGDSILAEPMYIALQMAGYAGDAHELVNHGALPRSRASGISLLQAVQQQLAEEDPDGHERIWNAIPQSTLEMLVAPEKYTGIATSKAVRVAELAEHYLQYS